MTHVDTRFVSCGGAAHKAALVLRHRVFYESSGISLEDVSDSLEDSSLHLVAQQGGAVLGYGRLTPQGREARISQMVVDETWRRQGVGSVLLAELIGAATDRGIVRLHLSAQLDAVPFYRRFGFVDVGEPSASDRLGIQVVRMEWPPPESAA